jgi:hypothetical protein
MFDCKPLGWLWAKFDGRYDEKNTIMFDDLRRNFVMVGLLGTFSLTSFCIKKHGSMRTQYCPCNVTNLTPGSGSDNPAVKTLLS